MGSSQYYKGCAGFEELVADLNAKSTEMKELFNCHLKECGCNISGNDNSNFPIYVVICVIVVVLIAIGLALAFNYAYNAYNRNKYPTANLLAKFG